MKQTIFISALIFGSFFSACKKEVIYNNCENPNKFEYFAFGTAYGECLGNCATFYKLSGGKVYPDSMVYYTGQLEFQSTALGQNKYLLAKQAMDNFPSLLANSPGETFGCPDCHDQGGIHIEIKKDGIVRTWHIDTDVSKQPVEIRNYIQQLYTILGQL